MEGAKDLPEEQEEHDQKELELAFVALIRNDILLLFGIELEPEEHVE